KGLGAKKSTTSDVEEAGEQVTGTAAGLLKPEPDSSPPKEIDAIRKYFEEALKEIGIRLVVLIDDLDRCLPSTTISTLEAIRLFLFLENTAFVIAADESMIRHAVGQHFAGLDDEELITNYFDKLIQIPIRVPPLGTQEVRAYMMLLFIDQSSLQEDEKETLREKICEQLGKTWQGKRVDRAFVTSLREDWPDGLLARFDAADRLAPIMATASRIAGNPRLVKRFLNALSIRISIARAQGIDIDEAVLAKMLLFERCGSSKAYAELAAKVSQSVDGKPEFLREWEIQASGGETLELDEPWDKPFEGEWLALSPTLADKDLRGILYVSREHAPIITPEDRLSSDAAEVLKALLEHPDMAQDVFPSLKTIPRSELQTVMDRLLERARKEQEWGTPDILEACLVVADMDPTSASRFADFLVERPAAQITASIVPRIADKSWAEKVFGSWEKSGRLSGPVKKAITRGTKNGNV
ncbi:MAG: ATPase, partial [Candidatus Hydrogenedentes bacterium]|nr:ATPase [Candidatus Hydrogenedentota bacterium]